MFWDKLSQNEDDLLYILDEHTPIKDCADLGHLLSDLGGINLLYDAWFVALVLNFGCKRKFVFR